MKKRSFLVAMDSFKGSGSSLMIGSYVKTGILESIPDAEVTVIPIADGGEGTLAAINYACQGEMVTKNCHNCLGEIVSASFGILDPKVAIIEAAQTLGLTLIDPTETTGLTASSYGLGEQILQVLDLGVEHVYIALGGSATNDGGVGMARALGIEFLDSKEKAIADGLIGLKDLARIDLSKLDERIVETSFTILSDVKNPLLGKSGAIYYFGQQKGLNPKNFSEYDRWMMNYSSVLQNAFNFDGHLSNGAGAAGGLGAALQVFCHGKSVNGINEVLKLIDFEEKIKRADMIFTGEGRMDAQSLFGKAPVGIGNLAKKYNKPVIALVGGRTGNLDQIYQEGITCVLPIVPAPLSLEEAIINTESGVIEATKTIFRCLAITLEGGG